MWPLVLGAAAWAWSNALWIGLGAWFLAYFVSVQLHPRTSCWKCGGDSKVRDESGRNFRFCFVCEGSGKRFRFFAIKRFMN